MIAEFMGERFEHKWLMQLSLFPKKKNEVPDRDLPLSLTLALHLALPAAILASAPSPLLLGEERGARRHPPSAPSTSTPALASAPSPPHLRLPRLPHRPRDLHPPRRPPLCRHQETGSMESTFETVDEWVPPVSTIAAP